MYRKMRKLKSSCPWRRRRKRLKNDAKRIVPPQPIKSPLPVARQAMTKQTLASHVAWGTQRTRATRTTTRKRVNQKKRTKESAVARDREVRRQAQRSARR